AARRCLGPVAVPGTESGSERAGHARGPRLDAGPSGTLHHGAWLPPQTAHPGTSAASGTGRFRTQTAFRCLCGGLDLSPASSGTRPGQDGAHRAGTDLAETGARTRVQLRPPAPPRPAL